MTSIQEFSKTFGTHPVPDALARLWAFQEEAGFENYAQGFGLMYDDKSGLANGWSADPAFLAQLLPFAQANGSGSFYAIWLNGSSNELSELPIVVFGDEGGEHVVAENIAGLLRVLSYDVEAGVDHDGVSYFKDEDDEYYEPSEYADDYQAWLKTQFQLTPPEDVEEEIVAPAQAKHQAAFNEWKSKFFES
ncbi:hypothetical protein [Chitinophaga vietnamensis]|uniref:hypothetical protein n=1 Tax=Chitinophaga vietnamensis TaxID=2593957 RepID=UPI001177ECA8|nr:hypothetical protein [Chitinophaga vietnamensis]